jgi:large subunit ribosomal protein L22
MAAVEEKREVRAEARFVRAAPRKAQLVADQIRGRTVPEARTILAFLARDAARDVEKVLSSAIANAEANHGLVGDELYVSAAYVGAGPTLKRWRARARGRVARIKKRTCHITIRLAQPEGVAVVAPPSPPRTRRAPPPAREPAPAEEAPKPKRARKTEAVETTEVAEKAEDKPKPRPKRAAKSKADETAKPKARRTPKKSDEAAKPAGRKKEEN